MTKITITPTDGKMCLCCADQIYSEAIPVEDDYDKTFYKLKQKVLNKVSNEIDIAYSDFIRHKLFKLD